MPKIGLVRRSWPRTAAIAENAKTAKPNVRAATPNAGASTIRDSQAGAGRPLVAASYRGDRQATARTVKLTVSAATAPATASSVGIGRSFEPPIPWARMSFSGLPYSTSSWTTTCSRSCDSTSTTPGLSMVSGRVVVPSP